MPDRELIDTGTTKNDVRREDRGRFEDVDDVGRPLTQDRRKDARTQANKGQGDRGDRPGA